MDFLQLHNKNIVVMGVANRRSVAWAVAKVLLDVGAKPIYVFKDQALLEKNRALIGADAPVVICDVEKDADLAALPAAVSAIAPEVHGLVHSIAFANYSEGLKPFHETIKK